MRMNAITPEVVLDELTKIVEEVGEDFVYLGDCRYEKEGRPSCIAGKVLFNLGVPVARLAELDTAGNTGSSLSIQFALGGGMFPKNHLPEISFTRDAVSVLTTAQRLQDWRNKYEKVLKGANGEVKRLKTLQRPSSA